ncbi:ATP-dependent DNA helicase [Mycena indigotica]|uniref:ATP-dependent DNA helicase n=1 Tax=Mycena indigotica TaxID=2126181 RepID=A0A8H6S7L4_9AGAR|nr:ATP-dependent DNA helicase [Mycena indigotica]KAF7293576.1 ATP-dependent DNA helicase [Mycena indigotica]
MLLHQPALCQAPPHFLCLKCRAKLVLRLRPPLSLANNMWIGQVPSVLSVLNLPELLLVGLYFPVAFVVKLFPKKAGSDSWDIDTMKTGLRGNVSTYRLNPSLIEEMVTGNIMPRPIGILAATISVTFVGAKNVPLFVLPKMFEVQRRRVHDALVWLQANNPLYANIEISLERLSELPEQDVPEELTTTARYTEDESVIAREHGGYVPSNVDDGGDAQVIEAEERDFGQRHDLLPVDSLDNENTNKDENYECDVIPLQPHGAVDISADSINSEELFCAAVNNLAPEEIRKYAVRPGEQRVDHQTQNHLLGTFPLLFPYGLGGIEVDRQDKVSYEEHVRWALQYDDGRFRKDLYFMFQAFGVQVKRENQDAFQRLTAQDFIKASKEEERKQGISNPTILAFRKHITAHSRPSLGNVFAV